MAPTVLRKSEELLKDASSDIEYLAYLQISNKDPFGEVYLTNGQLQSDAPEFFNLLSTEYTGKWIRQAVKNRTVSTSVTTPPEPLPRPRIKISPALADPQKVEAASPAAEPFPSASGLAYAMVAQGRTGSDCSKIVWKHSRREIARAMFEEVINGYSIVFSGVMLDKDYQSLHSCRPSHQFSLVMAESFPALLALGNVNAPANREAEECSHILEWKPGMNTDFKYGLFC